MTYVGIKFRTKIIKDDLPADHRVSGLKYWCKVFNEKGLLPRYDCGSYGNLSFRLNDGRNSFVITASKTYLGQSMRNDCFVTVVHVDLGKRVVYSIGKRDPSSEAMLHYAIYKKRRDVQAIFHGHSSKISKNAERIGIPITHKEEPYGTTALVKSVLEILDENCFIEMKNHGFLSLGKSLDDAGNLTLKLLDMC